MHALIAEVTSFHWRWTDLVRTQLSGPRATAEQTTMHENRRLMYAFLSRMYEREVTTDLIKELADEKYEVSQVVALQRFRDVQLGRGFETLARYLKGASGRDPGEVKLELAVEYANLFLGVKRRPKHPSESVYLSKEQSMYQEPRDRVLANYWNAGVSKTKEFTEPEDHVAIELQFMEYLCRRTVEALKKGGRDEVVRNLEIQKEFVNDHLARWVPALTKDILASAEVDFYKGVAEITDAFVRLDRVAIVTSLEEARQGV